jgi:spore coat protein U-like protein
MKRTAKLLTAAAAASMLLALGDAPANAATNTGNVTVQASVAKQCSVPNVTLNFGAYDPNAAAPLDQSQLLTVNCTKTTPYTVSLSLGANASGTTRRMTGSGDFLTYELYSDAAHTTIWNTTNTVAGTGGGASPTIFGRVFAAQFVTPASYTDTVVATVTF